MQYELPCFVMKQIDVVIEEIHEEITGIPEGEDDIKRSIHLTCTLNDANIEQINEEMQRQPNEYSGTIAAQPMFFSEAWACDDQKKADITWSLLPQTTEKEPCEKYP